ncbi:DUF4357 domain-containing protein, partial [Peptostreptococcus anaerobius]
PIVDKDTKEKYENNNDKESIFYLSRKSGKSNRQIEAKCKRTDEGFVVLKDSMIETIDSTAIPKSIKELRKECINKNEIIDGRISKDYLFNSPSYAAAFVLGTNANGKTHWKTENGITLKDLEENEMK